MRLNSVRNRLRNRVDRNPPGAADPLRAGHTLLATPALDRLAVHAEPLGGLRCRLLRRGHGTEAPADPVGQEVGETF
jgi:hypothetical protein